MNPITCLIAKQEALEHAALGFVLIGLWGIVIVPVEAQLVLGLLTLGGAGNLGMQADSLRP
ncbi:MAG: hypothetical protein WBC73_08385 [Phormidesmis sp.]